MFTGLGNFFPWCWTISKLEKGEFVVCSNSLESPPDLTSPHLFKPVHGLNWLWWCYRVVLHLFFWNKRYIFHLQEKEAARIDYVYVACLDHFGHLLICTGQPIIAGKVGLKIGVIMGGESATWFVVKKRKDPGSKQKRIESHELTAVAFDDDVKINFRILRI